MLQSLHDPRDLIPSENFQGLIAHETARASIFVKSWQPIAIIHGLRMLGWRKSASVGWGCQGSLPGSVEV